MRVAVDSLTRPGFPEGLDLTLSLDVDWVRVAATEALEIAPVALAGTVRVEPPVSPAGGPKRQVTIDVRFQADLVRPCDRCAEDVTLLIKGDEHLVYIPAPERVVAPSDHVVPDDVELDGAALDVGWYEGGALALDDVVCEVIALCAPAKVCCADGAACEERFQALLVASAASGAPTGHPGLAALRSFLPSS